MLDPTNAAGRASRVDPEIIIRAWQDPDFAATLADDVRALIPANPAGRSAVDVELGTRHIAGYERVGATTHGCSTDNCPSTHGCTTFNCPSTHGCTTDNCPSTHGCTTNNCPSTHGCTTNNCASTHGCTTFSCPSTHGCTTDNCPSTHGCTTHKC